MSFENKIEVLIIRFRLLLVAAKILSIVETVHAIMLVILK